ncbi:MAG: PorV/PorQ family protein [Elusimicrobia bacterium]|nr:PorV/PorQ family protein [Elusimicrobiota bacterium]
MKKFITLSAIIFISTPFSNIYALCGSGEDGGVFMRVVQSPRAAAMGDSGVAIGGDILASVSLNPATLSSLRYKEIGFVYTSWFEDIAMQQLAYAHPFDKNGVLAASISMLQVESFDGYDNFETPMGDVESSDMVISLLYSRRLFGPWNDLRNGLFMGAGVKYAKEKLDTVSANTTLFDLGALWVLPAGGGRFSIGASASSLPNSNGFKFDTEQDPAPTIYRGGIGYTTTLFGDPLALAFDLRKPSDDDTGYSFGIEYILKNIVAFRFGFLNENDMTDKGIGKFRFGAGFNLKLIKIDYALTSYGDFDLTHRISLSMKFGSPIDVTPHLTPEEENAVWHIEKAKEYMGQNRYYDAIVELNEALKLDPKNRDALRLMEKSKDMIDTIR